MRRCIARVCTVVAFLLVVGDGLAIANAGKSCTKVGAVNKKAGTVCARVKGKLVWQKSSTSTSGKSGFDDGHIELVQICQPVFTRQQVRRSAIGLG